MGAEDRRINPILRTTTDPRTAGRPAPIGTVVVYCDDGSSVATILVKSGTSDTAWGDQSAGSVVSADLADLAVTAAKLAADAVTTAKILDANVTAAKLAAAVLALIFGTPTITVAAQAGTARAASIQLKGLGGANLAAIANVRIWISDVAGGAPTASAPDGGVAITTGVTLSELVTDKLIDAVSNSSGVVAATLTHAGVGTTTWFVNVAVGAIVVASAAVALTN